jgi:hypothetical protein
MRVNLLLAAATVLMCAAGPAHAERFRVGRLICIGTPRIGLVVGSTQSLRCVFHARYPPGRYVYTGRLRRLGLDLGVTSVSSLSWIVLARNSRIRPSSLRGRYVGASGKLSLGPGLGVNALIGGSRRAIMLQPLSVERSIGVSVAAGVASLTLDARGRR